MAAGAYFFFFVRPLQNSRHWAIGQSRTRAQFWMQALLWGCTLCAWTALPAVHGSTTAPPSVMAAATTAMLASVFMGFSV
jgi:hypothetical protein